MEVGGGAYFGRPLGLRVAFTGPLVWGVDGVDTIVACPLSSEHALRGKEGEREGERGGRGGAHAGHGDDTTARVGAP